MTKAKQHEREHSRTRRFGPRRLSRLGNRFRNRRGLGPGQMEGHRARTRRRGHGCRRRRHGRDPGGRQPVRIRTAVGDHRRRHPQDRPRRRRRPLQPGDGKDHLRRLAVTRPLDDLVLRALHHHLGIRLRCHGHELGGVASGRALPGTQPHRVVGAHGPGRIRDGLVRTLRRVREDHRRPRRHHVRHRRGSGDHRRTERPRHAQRPRPDHSRRRCGLHARARRRRRGNHHLGRLRLLAA